MLKNEHHSSAMSYLKSFVVGLNGRNVYAIAMINSTSARGTAKGNIAINIATLINSHAISFMH